MNYQEAPIIADRPVLPEWAKQTINLVNPRMGAKIIAVSDEFFAPAERMLNPQPALFYPNKFDENGKWMDGWETRRKRSVGYDWAIISLAQTGNIVGFELDTSHFTGNYAPGVFIEGCLQQKNSDLQPDQEQWVEILPPTPLQGNKHHFFYNDNPAAQAAFSHLRINLLPDGGLARLRVYGHIHRTWNPGEQLDVIALENGGRVVGYSDAHFGEPQNLLLPGKGLNMGDGWETRRRRTPGNDWCIIRLAHKAVVESIEVDTAFFKGNYPQSCSIQAVYTDHETPAHVVAQSMFWPTLLAPVSLTMDSSVTFIHELQNCGAINYIKFNIFPDGGVSRLRLQGKVV